MIVAILAYFDEPAAWLRELVDTLPRLGVKHLVAADGAYQDFPNPTTDSGGLTPLRQRCGSNHIQLHHDIPLEPWPDQLAKRNALFRTAETLTTEDDWYFVVDADELVTHAPPNLPDLLEDLDTDVAEAWLCDENGQAPLRMFFRARRGLTVIGNHYTYQLPDGRRLWGSHRGDQAGLEPATLLPVKVWHRERERHSARAAAKASYYRARQESKTCAWCDQPATSSVPVNWRFIDGSLVGDRADVCDSCFPERYEESRQLVEATGTIHPALADKDSWFR